MFSNLITKGSLLINFECPQHALESCYIDIAPGFIKKKKKGVLKKGQFCSRLFDILVHLSND